MKKHTLPRFDWPSVRLALTYLGIIMVLSIGFSVIFYRTSTSSLDAAGLQVQSDKHNEGTRSSGSGSTSLSLTTGPHATTFSSDDAAKINDQLQKSVHAIRTNLARRLVLLNLGAVVVGSLVSYYLARRTLRPIEQAMDAQARFSSDASHELRTPLTALRARNEVALRKSKLTLAEAKQVISDSVEQAIKLQKLSDGLLRLSRTNSKGLSLSPVSLQEIVDEAMSRVSAAAKAKRITLEHSVAGAKVLADAESLTQVVTILLDNAIKYSDAGTMVYIESKRDGKHALLRVRDEGAGIRATDLPHIFERFYRADYARTTHGEHGYGLGLSIAEKLVTQNNGKISVESARGKGSTFTIKLSLA